MITPIIIPVHSSSEPQGPDHKCPNCGHEWDDEEEEGSIGGLVFLICIVLAFASVIAWGIDTATLGERYRMYFTVKDDCEYSHPNFEIVSNGDGLYAVKYNKTGEYFCYGKDYILFPPSIHPNITLFVSECNARGYLKAYVNRPFK